LEIFEKFTHKNCTLFVAIDLANKGGDKRFGGALPMAVLNQLFPGEWIINRIAGASDPAI
jgi:hypothetical protein